MDDERPHLIGKATSKLAVDDPGYWTAGLYRLPDRVSFLVIGAGGPDSPFAAETAGEEGRIVEMSQSDAFNWAASYLPLDTVEEYFDHLIEEI